MEIIVIHLGHATLMHSQANNLRQLAGSLHQGENPSFLAINMRNLAGLPWMTLLRSKG
jgi:hypothetical protein